MDKWGEQTQAATRSPLNGMWLFLSRLRDRLHLLNTSIPTQPAQTCGCRLWERPCNVTDNPWFVALKLLDLEDFYRCQVGGFISWKWSEIKLQLWIAKLSLQRLGPINKTVASQKLTHNSISETRRAELQHSPLVKLCRMLRGDPVWLEIRIESLSPHCYFTPRAARRWQTKGHVLLHLTAGQEYETLTSPFSVPPPVATPENYYWRGYGGSWSFLGGLHEFRHNKQQIIRMDTEDLF